MIRVLSDHHPAGGESLVLAAEQAQELARRSFAGSLVYFAVTIVASLATPYPRDHGLLILTVSCLMLGLGMLRVLSGRVILKGSEENRSGAAERLFRFATIGSFAGFGLFTAATVAYYGIEFTGVLILMSAACLAAGATSSLAPDKLLSWLCIGLMVLPVVVCFSVRGGPPGWSLASLALCYFGFLLSQAHENHRAYWEALQAGELRKAKQDAELVAKAKSELLARMSHEIRTPLNGVIGMLEVLLRGSLSDDQAERAKLCRSSALSLFSVLNSILDYSRAESGTIQPEAIEFNLRESIQLALAPLVFAARDKGLEFESEIHPAVGVNYRGDPVRINQVVINLVSNAIKFTSVGRVRVEIKTSERQLSKDWILITVRDTGIGMTEQARRKLFTPFMQAESFITRVYGGTGLGLAISSQLARVMGGSLEVESEAGAGSTFRFLLPLASSDAPEAANSSHSTVPAPRRAGKILVVEDNVVNQRVAQQLLRHLGFEADLAVDGEQALAAVATQDYALILMDCQMPKLDGWAATRRIREMHGVKARIPIIGVSAIAVPEERDRSLAAGMDAFLAKPFTMEELAEVVEAGLNSADGWRARALNS